MNKKIYLLPLLLLVALFTTSCEETKEVGKYDNWQARSEAFIDSIADVYAAQTPATPDKDRLYAYVNEYDLSQTIYVKKLPLAEDAVLGETPLYTSKVSVYYRGSLFNKEVFEETFSGANPELFGSTAEFKVNEVIAGWTWALQHMRVGERWMIYIPWKSAYGSSPKTSIPAYSALVFDVKLNNIVYK